MNVVSFQTFEEPARTKSLLLRIDLGKAGPSEVFGKPQEIPGALFPSPELVTALSHQPCLLHALCCVPAVCWPYRGVWITSVQLAP